MERVETVKRQTLILVYTYLFGGGGGGGGWGVLEGELGVFVLYSGTNRQTYPAGLLNKQKKR